jgi:cell division septum initiation protein DivIVA
MKGSLTAAISVAALALLPVAAAAAEEGPTRAQYVEQVEPICQANTEANKRILKNVRTKAKSGVPAKLKQAGGQFIHASAVFGKTVEKLDAVPRPSADDARLLKWFAQLGIVQSKLRALGVALKADDEIKAAHEQIRVERASNAANNYSFVFGFHYCHLTPSRFV